MSRNEKENFLTDGVLLERIFKSFKLSYAQMDTARLLLHGLSNAEIANSLGIQEKTVKFHVTDIYRRTGVQSRAQFIIKFQYDYMRHKIETESAAVWKQNESVWNQMLTRETARLQACQAELQIYKSSSITRTQLVSVWPKYIESMKFCTALKQSEVKQKSLDALLEHLNLK